MMPPRTGLLRASGFPDEIQAGIAAAAKQTEMQRKMEIAKQAMMQATMNGLGERHVLNGGMVHVMLDGTQKVLCVATPSGCRYEIPMDEATCVAIANQLVPPAQEAAA